MSGTIAFGGVGSGLDTEGIVTGLVKASSGHLDSLKSRASDTKAAISSLSDVGSLLSRLQTSVQALATDRDVQSFKATSSGSAIAASANGLATGGSYSVDVLALAKEQRTYSDTFASSNIALGQAGTLTLKAGSGTAVDLTIAADDTLDSITGKINAAGIRASASLFFDGTNYRMQVRGLDTGAANALTITESSGVSLGLSKAANTFQQAGDAKVKIDGYEVTRPTNQIQGAIAGVTLAVTDVTTSSIKVSVDTDPSALQNKLQSVVDAYNAVINKVHTVAGYGTTTASVSALAGDSTLRSLTDRLASGILQSVSGSGTFTTLASIGLSVTKDGTLGLNGAKLGEALTKDAGGVTKLLAGTGSGSSANGVMDMMRDLVASFSNTGTGLLSTHKDALNSQVNRLNDSAAAEQARLDAYAESLRKQFTAMDSTVAGYNSLSSYLNKLG